MPFRSAQGSARLSRRITDELSSRHTRPSQAPASMTSREARATLAAILDRRLWTLCDFPHTHQRLRLSDQARKLSVALGVRVTFRCPLPSAFMT
jgi:hypothetical protein